MGCDIHLYAEKRQPDGSWLPIAPTNVHRNSLKEGEESPTPYRFPLWDGEKLDGAFELSADVDDDGNPVERRRLAPWFQDRNYNLFSMLADVRNGRGFAGCDTGDGFTPIFDPRGIPEDASQAYRDECESWGCDGHSHTHMLVSEWLAYVEKFGDSVSIHRGVVGHDEYLEFKKKGSPSMWSGMTSGPGLYVIHPDDYQRLLDEGKLEIPELNDVGRFMGRFPTADPSVLDGITPASKPYHPTHDGKIRLCTFVQWGTPYYQDMGRFPDLIKELLQHGKPEDIRMVMFFDN